MVTTKDWRSEDSTELFDKLNAVRTQAIAIGLQMPAHATTAKAKQAAVTKILGAFGLKTKKKDGGNSGDYYIITEESLQQMIGYIK
ncbi:hypothetical protein D9M70_645710 [compost metagenome]